MLVADITRAETGERARLVRVQSYDVALDLTRGPEIFGSASVIRFDCREPGAATHVELIAERVHEITLNGVSIDPAQAVAGGRIRLPALAARNELRVTADCRYASDGTGLQRSVDPADGRVYTYTKFEPAYARRVFANFEQPDLKAAFTVHVTAPAHWTVLSNQPEPEPAGEGDGTGVWHFPVTPLISTYLTALAAGEYLVVRASHTTRRGQAVPLALACRASLAGHLDADEVFGLTRQGLDFFTGLFGCDYPFAKYDQVFVPDYSVGATENVGCVVISDELLFRSRVTDTMRELRAMVILHEMAHMWFGDLVTMRWWDDLWLSEAFAEFCGTLASAEATRFSGAWSTFCSGRKAWGYMQDQLPATHPIAADVPTLSGAVANFDGISYAKGASVLRQLAAYLGRPAFIAGIRGYLAGHAWGNATLADLLAALEAHSQVSLADWSRAWLQTAGPNTLRCSFAVDDGGTFTSFAVVQEAPREHPRLRPHHLAVGLYSHVDGALTRVHRQEVDLTGARAELPELVGVRQPDLIGRPAGLPGLTADAELRWAILRRLAATGRAGDAEIEAELARDATDAGARHATACRAAVPDAGHKAMAWRLLAETDDLGVLAAVETSRGFLQPEQAALLAPYTERYFEALPGIWAMRGEHIRVQLSQLLFPHPASSPRLLERIDAFLAAERPDPGLTRVLTEKRDIVARAMRSRALPAGPEPAP